MDKIINFFWIMAGFFTITALVLGFNQTSSKENNKLSGKALPNAVVDYLGNMVYAGLVTNHNVCECTKEVEFVTAVVDRLVQAARTSPYAGAAKKFQWKFSLLDDPGTADVKAFPGGKIIIYSGLIDLVEQDQAHLATVLAPQMAHALRRHAAFRFNREYYEYIMGLAAKGALRKENLDLKLTIAIMGAMGVGYQDAEAPAFDQRQQKEADRLGLMLMTDAGYDPNCAIAFFQKLKEEQLHHKTTGFWADPLNLDNRIMSLQNIIAKMP